MKIRLAEGMLDRRRDRRVDILLADSIARDMHAAPDDLRVRLLAATTGAALVTAGDNVEPGPDAPIDYEHAITMLEQMLDVLNTGPTELRPARHTRSPEERRAGQA